MIIPETGKDTPSHPSPWGLGKAEEATTKLGMFKGASDGSPRWVLGSEH